MKKSLVFALFVIGVLASCAPVLRHDLMESGIRDFSMPDLVNNPGMYEGKLFILGGVIINTKATAEGSLIEALYVPVNARGYLKDIGALQHRFLALFPKENGFLDPFVFKKNREITFAGEFRGLREGEIDEMKYAYPFFVVRQLYLWAERQEYYYWPYYYEPYPYWWDYPYRWYGYPYGVWRYRVPPPYWW